MREQQRLWRDRADAQARLSLPCSHTCDEYHFHTTWLQCKHGQNRFAKLSYEKKTFSTNAPSPVPDLEILLEVNLSFQVRLTIILVCGIFSRANGSGSSMLKYNGSNPSLLKLSVELDRQINLRR